MDGLLGEVDFLKEQLFLSLTLTHYLLLFPGLVLQK
jgi:hypothetical protein